MFNKSQLSKDQKDAKKPRSLAKPKDIDYVSKMGYRDDSPFNDRPYIDINTPNGVIDMSNTGIDLIANGRFLPKYSGFHQLGDTKVREIPAAQMGGEQYVDLTDEEIEEYRRGGYIVEELPKAQTGVTTGSVFRRPDSWANIPEGVITVYSHPELVQGSKDINQIINSGVKLSDKGSLARLQKGFWGIDPVTGTMYTLPKEDLPEIPTVTNVEQDVPTDTSFDNITLPVKPITEQNIQDAFTPTKPEMVWIKETMHPEKNMFGKPKRGQERFEIEKQVAAGSKEANRYFASSQHSPDSIKYFHDYPMYDAAGRPMYANTIQSEYTEVPATRQFTTEGAYPYGYAPPTTPEQLATEQQLNVRQKGGKTLTKAQTAGTTGNNNGCPEGHWWDPTTGTCVPMPAVQYVEDENDPRYKKYLDQMNLYKYSTLDNYYRQSDYVDPSMVLAGQFEDPDWKWTDYVADLSGAQKSYQDENKGYYGSQNILKTIPASELKNYFSGLNISKYSPDMEWNLDKDYGQLLALNSLSETERREYEALKRLKEEYPPQYYRTNVGYTHYPIAQYYDVRDDATYGSSNYWMKPDTQVIEDSINRDELKKIYPLLTDAQIDEWVSNIKANPDYITNKTYQFNDNGGIRYRYINGEDQPSANANGNFPVTAISGIGTTDVPSGTKAFLPDDIQNSIKQRGSYIPIWGPPSERFEIKPKEPEPEIPAEPEMVWIKEFVPFERNMFGKIKKGQDPERHQIEKQVVAGSKEANDWFRQNQWSPDSVAYFQKYPMLDASGRKTMQNIAVGQIPESRQFTTEGAYPYGQQPAATTPEEKAAEQEIDVRREGGYVSKQMVHFLTGGAYEESPLPQAQKGSQVYTYADRPEATYKKDSKGNWLISLPSTNGKYVPIKDPTGKRAGELNEKAVLDPSQFRKQYDPLVDIMPQVAESTAVRNTSAADPTLINKAVQQKQAERKIVGEKIQANPLLSEEQKFEILTNPQILDEYGYLAYEKGPDTVKSVTPHTLGERAWDIATNPFAAFEYAIRTGDVSNMPYNYNKMRMAGIDPSAGGGSNLVGQALNSFNLIDAGDKVVRNTAQGNYGTAALEALRFLPGARMTTGLGKYSTAVKNAVANPGALLPKYKNVYRVEPTTFKADPNKPLRGNWFGELGEMPFYAQYLKDPNAGVRIMRQKMPVKQWEAMSGHNLPAQAKTMSAGPGDYKTFADAAKNGEISMGAAKRLQAGMQTSRDLEELAANPRLINLSEGVLPEQLVNKIRNTKGSKWYSNKETIEYPATDQGRQGAQDHLWQLLGQQYKNQGYEKPILGIPRTYFPFEEGGSAGKPANRWAVTDPRSMQVDNYFPKLAEGGSSSQLYIHPDRKDAVYKKDSKGKWLIKSNDTSGKFVPLKDSDGKRAANLNKYAVPAKAGSNTSNTDGQHQIGLKQYTYASPWKDAPDTPAEDLGEIFDPTGLSSWDDVARSYNREGLSGNTALEIFGAIPFLGKLKWAGETAQNLSKSLANTARQKRSAQTFSNVMRGIGNYGPGASRFIDGYQAYANYFPNNLGPKYQDGGNKDSGNNALELHMFYDKDVYKKMQKGGTKTTLGEDVYTYADRPEAQYKKDPSGGWHIMLPSTNGEFVPINDPSGQRSGELNEKAQIYVDPKKFRRTYDPMADFQPVPSETTQQVAGNLSEQVKASNSKSLNKFIENSVVLPNAPKIDENTPMWYPTNDIYYSPEEIEKQSTEYNRRMEECKKGDAQCFEQAQRYYNNYVAPLLNVPDYNEIKTNMGVTSGNTHPNYDKYGKSLDSWDAAAWLAENEGKVFYKGDINNPRAFQNEWNLSMWDPLYTEEQQNKYNDYWKGLNLPLGTIINAGYEGGTGGNYGYTSYNKEKGFVPSNHTGIVVGYDKDGVPYVYDNGEIVSAADPMSLINRMGVTNIVAPKDVLNNTFGSIGTGEKVTPDINTKLRFDTSKMQYDPDEFKPFMNVLTNEKDMIRKALGVSDAEYNELARQAMATALAETGGGDDTTIRWQNGVPIPSYLKDKSGIDLNLFGTPSTGISQINPSVLFSNKDPQLARMLDAMGLDKESYDPWDPRDAAMATMAMIMANKKVAEANYKSNPTNDPTMNPAMMQYYQWNTPGTLRQGEAWGENANVQRFMDIYNSLVPIDAEGNRIFKQGGSYEVTHLTDKEIKELRKQGIRVEIE